MHVINHMIFSDARSRDYRNSSWRIGFHDDIA
jgi:hypothetical protein